MTNQINQNNNPCLWGDFSLELGYITQGNPQRVFDFEYPFYDPDHKSDFEAKFLLHFKYHEIGQETIGRFKDMLKDTLIINYPKYLHYYKVYMKAQDMPWWYNKDYETTEERDLNFKGDRQSDNKSNSTSDTYNENTTSSNEKDLNKYLETPQGRVQSLDDCYLTNVTQDESNSIDQTSGTTSSKAGTSSNDKTLTDNTEKEITKRKEQGNIGTTTAGQIVKSWLRDAYINVDKMILDDCDELFMQVYGGFCD